MSPSPAACARPALHAKCPGSQEYPSIHTVAVWVGGLREGTAASGKVALDHPPPGGLGLACSLAFHSRAQPIDEARCEPAGDQNSERCTQGDSDSGCSRGIGLAVLSAGRGTTPPRRDRRTPTSRCILGLGARRSQQEDGPHAEERNRQQDQRTQPGPNRRQIPASVASISRGIREHQVHASSASSSEDVDHLGDAPSMAVRLVTIEAAQRDSPRHGHTGGPGRDRTFDRAIMSRLL